MKITAYKERKETLGNVYLTNLMKKEQLVLSAQNDTAVNMEENRTGETLQSDNDDTVDKPKVTEQSTADVDDTRADLAAFMA